MQKLSFTQTQPKFLQLIQCFPKVCAQWFETLEDYIPALLNRVKLDYMKKIYRLNDWTDPTDFLEKVARRTGKLLKVRTGTQKGNPSMLTILSQRPPSMAKALC